MREIIDHAQPHVGERADGQRDLLTRQPPDQRLILHGAHAVIDARDAKQVERLPDVARRPLLPGMGGEKKARVAGAGEHVLEPGGFPRSDESSPTPTMRSLNGSAASRVRSASASSRWRRKHMIRLASTPSFRPASAIARVRPSTTVANATPRPVWPCGSKNISTWRTLSACARAR